MVETELHLQSHIIHIEDGSISIIALHVYSFENLVYESCGVFKVFGMLAINLQYSVFAEGFLVQWERYIGIESIITVIVLFKSHRVWNRRVES